uniref:C-type lectin domain-containing protein n=1 Tax=Panagrellus redivivus TaxID=6233 RepID=A0A7E4VCT5_PANRE
MLLLLVFLAFAAHQSSVSADYKLPKTKYPGLTLGEARCPESVSYNEFWFLVPYYNDAPFCFIRKTLPAKLRTIKDVEAVCREVDETAFPARLFYDLKLSYINSLSLTENAMIGAYFIDNINGIISSDEAVIFVHNSQVIATNIETFSADPTGKGILCMMPAYPRFMHSYHIKPINHQPNLAEYECEGNGWDLQASCGGTPFCYKTIDYSGIFLNFQTMLTEFNVCGMKEPNSFVASVHYPGLSLAEARCPESASDEDFWFLVPVYNNTPVCFIRRSLPANLRTFKDVEVACREKHEKAFPARLYRDQKLKYLRYGVPAVSIDLTENAIIGAFFKDDLTLEETEFYDINSSDRYAIYLSRDRAYAINVTEFSANPKGKHILCMMPPYPRVTDSYYRKNVPSRPNLTEYTCEGDGWDLQSFCDGKPYCYKRLNKFKAPLPYEFYTEFNACGIEEPNSFLASIHCQDEYGYLRFKYAGQYQIGLYLPHRGPWNRFNSWQWADGTPADWIPWHRGEPQKCHSWDEKTVYVEDNYDFIDYNIVNTNRAMPAICKKPAVKKQLPLDIKRYSTFELNWKKCRSEPVTHWNHQCPTNSSLWQIVQSEAGVHCYALVDTPMQLELDNFTHELCHDLHPNAKLASFHYDSQFGFLYPENAYLDKIIVGLVPNNQTFIWADGTPVNKSFWAQSEPPVNSSNLVVKITNARGGLPQYPGCGDRFYNRPLFKTMKIEDVKADMKIACKIEAEPLLSCAPVPDANGMESLNNTFCPDGWVKQRFCDKVSCYKRIHVESIFQNFSQAVERDYCHILDPESYLASIHCVEEHFFVQSYPAQTLIGLHIPTKFYNDTFNVKNFEWTDGTPVDFVGWNRFSNPETNDYQYAPLFPRESSENIKFSQVYNKIHDTKSGWSNQFYAFQHVLCKMRATVIKKV